MLDQEGDEALMSACGRAVDDVGALEGVVRRDVAEVHALGHGEVELVGAGGLLAAGHGLELEVDLRPVEGRLALDLAVGQAGLVHGGAHELLGAFPGGGVVDVLLAPLGILGIPGGEAHVVVLDPHGLVEGLVHLHDREELGLDLLLGAVDVRVVHAHAAHAQQAGDGAGVLVAVHLPVLGQPQREVAVALLLRLEDQVVVGAVHGLQHVGVADFLALVVALLQLHEGVHALLVVGEVPGLVVEGGAGDVGGGHAQVAGAELQLLHVALQLVAQDGAVGHPEGQSFTDLLVDGEDAQLAAELLVVARLGFLEVALVRLELVLGGEGPGVEAGHHHVARVAAPVGAGDGADLEGVRRDGAGAGHVGALAHVEEGSVAEEAQGGDALFVEKFLGVLLLVGLAHGVEALHGLLVGQVLLGELLVLLDDAPHALLDVGEILLANRLGQDEVVVEPIVDGRAEPQLAAGAHLQHGLRQDMGEAVADLVQVVFHFFHGQVLRAPNNGARGVKHAPAGQSTQNRPVSRARGGLGGPDPGRRGRGAGRGLVVARRVSTFAWTFLRSALEVVGEAD